MLADYIPLLIILGWAVFVGFFVVILGAIFGPRRPIHKKSVPYESGMKPYGAGARRVSIRYYLVAVLFILFDIEVIFVLPWAVVFRELGVPGLLLMLFFMFDLTVGFIYAWKKGALEWE